jgi:hypothetical protein
LVAAAIEMATQDAFSFVDLGMTPASGNAPLSPVAAVGLLDRVQSVLNAAQGEFAAALKGAKNSTGGDLFHGAPAAAPDGFLTAAEMLKLMGMTGLKDAEGFAGGFPYTARDDTASLEKVIELFKDDPLGGASERGSVLQASVW